MRIRLGTYKFNVWTGFIPPFPIKELKHGFNTSLDFLFYALTFNKPVVHDLSASMTMIWWRSKPPSPFAPKPWIFSRGPDLLLIAAFSSLTSYFNPVNELTTSL